MKKLLLAGLAIVAFAGVANAETNACVRPYISAKANYSKMAMNGKAFDAGEKERISKKDWVGGASLAASLKMCAFRTELEFNQSLSAKDTYDDLRTKQSYRSYMLNGYFDLPTGTDFHPYVGAGIGVARIKTRLSEDDFVDKNYSTNLAWQAGGGIGYNLTRNWTLDIGYRYVNNGHNKWKIEGDKVKVNTEEHQITAGVRYTF